MPQQSELTMAMETTMLVFLSLAGIGLLFLLISAFGGDHIEVHPEVEVGGVGFLSLRGIAVFLTAFGTVGAIARWYGKGAFTCSAWGLASGVVLSLVYVLIMNLVKSQEASSLVVEAELLGCTGRLTVGIPAGGLGEVSCTSRSQTVRRLVRVDHGGAVPEGTIVRIRDVQGDVLIVEELESASRELPRTEEGA